MEFKGIPPEAYDFFLAIRFNNNAEFFHDQHAWYLRAVREPLLALAEGLQPVLWEMDAQMDARPGTVVSRLRRDTRFSRDKAPYRDYMWLGYRLFGLPREELFLPYFDVGVEDCGVGLGCYAPKPSLMRSLRARILAMPSEFDRALEPCREMHIVSDEYRRLPPDVPKDCPESLRPWLMRKSFYVETRFSREQAETPELLGLVSGAFRALTPLYRFIRAAAPEQDQPSGGEGDSISNILPERD